MTSSQTTPTSMGNAVQGPAAVVVTVGVVSDTHGHLYPQVRQALGGVDHVIHAGDVGSPQVLAELRKIAPVTAVRGNCDLDPWADALPVRAEVELGGARMLVGHVAGRLEGHGDRVKSDPGRFAAVITGHTHMAALERRDGTLYLNPGSAGPGRFGRPRTVARITIRPAAGEGPGASVQIDAEVIVIPS